MNQPPLKKREKNMNKTINFTPYIYRFVKEQSLKANKCNHSLIIKLKEKISEYCLQSIFNEIIRKHKTLSLNVTEYDSQLYYNKDNNINISFTEWDEYEHSFNLYQDLVIKVFKSKNDYLKITFNLLMTDNYSFHILLNDLDYLLLQTMNKQKLFVKRESYDYDTFVNLNEYNKKAVFFERKNVEKQKDYRIYTVHISKCFTKLIQIGLKYGLEQNELILAIFAYTYILYYQNSFIIELESNGREGLTNHKNLFGRYTLLKYIYVPISYNNLTIGQLIDTFKSPIQIDRDFLNRQEVIRINFFKDQAYSYEFFELDWYSRNIVRSKLDSITDYNKELDIRIYDNDIFISVTETLNIAKQKNTSKFFNAFRDNLIKYITYLE